MKKALLFLLLIASAISYGIYNSSVDQEKLTESNSFIKKKQLKAENAVKALEWRLEGIRNVETGEIDRNDYYKAVAHADALKENSPAANKAGGVVGIEWVSRGPDSQGGRTRTMLFDKDDDQLMFTGSISGGLYKSTDGAQNWEKVPGYFGSNAAVMSLAQSSDGTIFVGTGEGIGNAPNGAVFANMFAGDGIYKSHDLGETWEQIASTNINVNPGTSTWSEVNVMAAHPSTPDLLLAGLANGIQVSTNSTSATPTFTSASGISGVVTGVAFTSDGQEAWASAGGRVYYSNDVAGNFSSWTVRTPASSSRAQIAVSNIDDLGDYKVYVSFTNGSGCLSGVYRTEDKGNNWSQIIAAPGTGGDDPFKQPTGTSCQGWYDHCIAVNPIDADKIYIGGITLYTWGSGSGGMKRADQIDSEGAGTLDPNYIHADKHGIFFSPHDATGNTMVIVGDGGVSMTKNANSGFPDNMVFTENNKEYITLQCYSAGSGKYGEVISGAQDNGTQYIDYKQISLQAAKEASGGDGVGGAEISNLSLDILFSGSQDGNILRSFNNGESNHSFTDGNIDIAGCGFISCVTVPFGQTCDDITHGAPFIYHFYLMETFNRPTPQGNAYIFARDEVLILPGGAEKEIKDTIPAGDVTEHENLVIENIPNLDLEGLGVSFDLPTELMPGDTFPFANSFEAKYFVPSGCGSKFFVCTNPLQVGASPEFSSIVISGQSSIVRMDASLDGDMLVAVTSNGRALIMKGWDDYTPTNQSSVSVINVNVPNASSLSGVSVSKNDKNHVLVTEDGYGSNSKVFVSTNALSATPTFTNIHNNLPEMPIYACVIDKANPNRYILGTELGIWASNDAGATWHEENDGIGGRMPVKALRQEWMNNFDCWVLTAGAMGAGLYTSTSLMDCADKDDLIWGRPEKTTNISQFDIDVNNILVYPNPVKQTAKIAFNLANKTKVTIKIIDMVGKVVGQKTFDNLNPGLQDLSYDVSDLASSTYFAVISTDDKTYSNKLFVKE